MFQRTGSTTDSTTIAALVIDGPQPVWMTLNEARERSFTGEIVFELDPEARVYLDNGIVYYAERVTDMTLGRRLLDSGGLDLIQLERGTVRVGDIEHLGRLFDRDPSIDRDVVIVFAEAATAELITELANRMTSSVRVTAYRHHPSGVHRWFVAPFDQAAPLRPVSAVAQLDSTVLDQLPGLPFGSGDEELTIEWNDPLVEPHRVDELGPTAPAVDDDSNGADVAMTDSMTDAMTDSMTDAMTDSMTDTVDELDELNGLEFTVVWPDDSEERAESTAEEPQTYVVDDGPAFTPTDVGDIRFVVPPLVLSDEPESSDSGVPDDVADAVRRAIAAIESVTVPTPTPTPTADATPTAEVTQELPEFIDISVIDMAILDDAAIESADVASSEFGAFAPPSLATSAEVLYQQLTIDSERVGGATLATAGPAGGDGHVAAGDDAHDRSSALRRLIGGLRRTDY